LVRSNWGYALLVAVTLLSPAVRAESRRPLITVDAARTIGTIKPLQDLGEGPLLMRGSVDETPYYQALGVKYVRLHDVPWVYDNVQDTNYVFPNDSADSAKPESYDFALTDHYIESMTSVGVEVIYRLGYSSEDYVPEPLRHVQPPQSYEKWTEVAAHIVEHYDKEWVGGPRRPIKYWEIWNEPDNTSFWTGTAEQYFRLYDMVAKRLKGIDPTLKVGGPALAGHVQFLEDFLKYCRDHQSPLDFVSWHSYAGRPEDAATAGRQVHELMQRYGYGDAQSILDEWNYDLTSFTPREDRPGAPYVPGGTQKYYEITRSAFGAAFDASVLIALQDASVDIATFYTGTNMFMGLFSYAGDPTKAYYAFLAFRRLLDSPERIPVEGAGERLKVLAGRSVDKKSVRVLLAYTGNDPYEFDLRLSGLPWDGTGIEKLQTIDGRAKAMTLSQTKPPSNGDLRHIRFEGPTVQLITLQAP
jgi:hypothetical protein